MATYHPPRHPESHHPPIHHETDFQNPRLMRLRTILPLLFMQTAFCMMTEKTVPLYNVSTLTLGIIDKELQSCALVQDLTNHKLARTSHPSSALTYLLDVLFPSQNPAINALLATLYISGPPNLLLALCPPDVDPSTLSVMVAFAVGGLLGDTLFHLLPEIFVGEDEENRVRFVMVEPKRNLVLGVGILVGFLTFVAMDKGLRIGTGGGGHDHGHSHSHSHSHDHSPAPGDKLRVSAGTSSAIEASDKGLKSRKRDVDGLTTPSSLGSIESAESSQHSVRLGGYLNLIADFTHNITDGLAMSASFYASPTVGATTALAVFFHEIPHEVGDFALLVQSGFSKRAAMGAQFVTAMGALLGTLIGIAVQEFGGGSQSGDGGGGPRLGQGIFGTSLTWGGMLLPFTAGTFLYVGTVAAIPELLETGPNKMAELRKMLVQFAAVFLGAGIMLFISWQE